MRDELCNERSVQAFHVKRSMVGAVNVEVAESPVLVVVAVQLKVFNDFGTVVVLVLDKTYGEKKVRA